MADSLDLYRKKRDFKKTPEPAPKKIKKKQGFSFCIQKHDATRLHYDFRLELDGVLKSWAVTRGPSYNPADRRLAVRTEDHPLDYGDFEGTIPKGQYGGGTVMLWDRGSWEPITDPHEGLKDGHLKFKMSGERLKGIWALVRMKPRSGDRGENWLLIKDNDDEAFRGTKAEKFLDKNAFSIKTGRKMEEIAADKDHFWKSNKSEKLEKKDTPKSKVKKKASSKGRHDLKSLQKLFPSVQLATLVTEPPATKGWIHEIKFDGYRILCLVSNGEVRIMTRNGHDWTDRFPAIVNELEKLDVTNAVLDGEAVVLNGEGISHFSSLQEALGEKGDPSQILAYFFDLVFLNDEDLSKNPLIERKKELEKLLSKQRKNSFLKYSDHFETSGDILSASCNQGLEGLISKLKDASYTQGRAKTWLKSKCNKRQEFVIVGYTPAKDNFRSIGALHLAFNRDNKLQYAGKVGTGFNARNAKEVYDAISKLEIDKPAVDIPRLARKSSIWVKPKILCEVTFIEWTNTNHVRHPTFEGLRLDKTAKEVTKEMPMETKKAVKSVAKKKSDDEALVVGGVNITHPERKIFDNLDITKGDLAQYMEAVAPYMLQIIKKYPISLVRCPSGITGDCFFQRNPDAHMKKFVKPFIWVGGRGNTEHEYFYVENAKGIISLIQMGVIEIHPWGSTVDKIDKPTRIIFDLDPDEEVDFEAVKLAALDIRQRLKKLGLESFLKTSGGKGLHIIVPIAAKYTWDKVKEFAGEFANQMARDVPEAYVATMTKKKRTGKIFIDYFRNDYTATAIADYGVRARPGGPVALPIEWSELKNLKSANQFKMNDVIQRLKKKKPDTKRYSLKQNLPK